MRKTVRTRYTLAFKQNAVRRVEGSQRIAAAARSLRGVEPPLLNWLKAQRLGKREGVDSKVVTTEQMKRGRLRAKLARMTMEGDISGQATAQFAKPQS